MPTLHLLPMPPPSGTLPCLAAHGLHLNHERPGGTPSVLPEGSSPGMVGRPGWWQVSGAQKPGWEEPGRRVLLHLCLRGTSACPLPSPGLSLLFSKTCASWTTVSRNTAQTYSTLHTPGLRWEKSTLTRKQRWRGSHSPACPQLSLVVVRPAGVKPGQALQRGVRGSLAPPLPAPSAY